MYKPLYKQRQRREVPSLHLLGLGSQVGRVVSRLLPSLQSKSRLLLRRVCFVTAFELDADICFCPCGRLTGNQSGLCTPCTNEVDEDKEYHRGSDHVDGWPQS